MKRRYQQQDEPDDGGIEQRLVNLLVRVGDKNLNNLPTHVKGLAGALKADLDEHRQLIIDTVFDCVRALQPKTAVYGALVGVLAAEFPDLGEEIASVTQSTLQLALADHAPLSIRKSPNQTPNKSPHTHTHTHHTHTTHTHTHTHTHPE